MTNVTIQGDADTLSVGDQLTCTGEGDPLPTYQWSATTGSVTFSPIPPGPLLNVTMEMAGENVTFVCTASNYLSNVDFTATEKAQVTIYISK